MALIAASAVLLINNCHASYHQERNVYCEGCISGESDQRTVWLEKGKIAILAVEYARWRSSKYSVMTLASSEQMIRVFLIMSCYVRYKTLV